MIIQKITDTKWDDLQELVQEFLEFRRGKRSEDSPA